MEKANDCKVSIIVCAYKAEGYIDRCLSSILSQTYKDYEIIIVDDGSPDSTGIICDKYAEDNKCIKVLHKENGGLCSARNRALELATGTLIGFVDSDDWIASDMLAYCVDLIEKNNADAIQIEHISTSNINQEIKPSKEEVSIYKGKDILQFYMDYTTRTGSYLVCKCLFRKKVLEGFQFREGKINEDIDYKFKALRNCNLFVVSNQIKYYYYQVGVSLSKGGLKKRDFDLYDAAEELYNLAKDEEYGTIKYLADIKRKRTAFSLLCKIAYYGIADTSLDYNTTVKKLLKEHRKNVNDLIKAPIQLSRKVLAVIFAISFPLGKVLVRLAMLLKMI